MDDAKAPLYLLVSIYEFVFDCIHSCTPPPPPPQKNKQKQTNKQKTVHARTNLSPWNFMMNVEISVNYYG